MVTDTPKPASVAPATNLGVGAQTLTASQVEEFLQAPDTVEILARIRNINPNAPDADRRASELGRKLALRLAGSVLTKKGLEAFGKQMADSEELQKSTTDAAVKLANRSSEKEQDLRQQAVDRWGNSFRSIQDTRIQKVYAEALRPYEMLNSVGSFVSAIGSVVALFDSASGKKLLTAGLAISNEAVAEMKKLQPEEGTTEAPEGYKKAAGDVPRNFNEDMAKVLNGAFAKIITPDMLKKQVNGGVAAGERIGETAASHASTASPAIVSEQLVVGETTGKASYSPSSTPAEPTVPTHSKKAKPAAALSPARAVFCSKNPDGPGCQEPFHTAAALDTGAKGGVSGKGVSVKAADPTTPETDPKKKPAAAASAPKPPAPLFHGASTAGH